MSRINWVAVDERYPGGDIEDIVDLVSVAPEQFAALAVHLDTDAGRMLAAAKRLRDRFGICLIPVISAESLKGRPDAVLKCLSALSAAGFLGTERRCPPAVLVRPSSGQVAIDGDAIPLLRRALLATSGVRLGWINHIGTLAAAPVGFDFSVDWPPFDYRPSDGRAEVRPVDALDLAIEAARRHANDAALALSVLVGVSTDGSYEFGATKVTGLDAPIEQLWLDSARRFSSNRFGYGIPYVFVRLIGSKMSPMPSWLSGYLRRPEHSSWLCPERAEPVSAPRPTGTPPRIAVVVHLYYPDLWPEFRVAIESIAEPVDVYVSTPLLIAKAVRARILRDLPDAIVFGTRNIGRDVLPFLHVLRSVGVDRYEYVLKLHSKKSMHMDSDDKDQVLGGGEAWRRKAIDELAGSRQTVSALLHLMDADARVGIVAPAGHLFEQARWRCGTANLVARLNADLGIDSTAAVFPAGTMFWVRPAAIATLVFADPGILDFEREAGQVDGTLHHAIERTLAHVVVAAGYRLLDTSIADEFRACS